MLILQQKKLPKTKKYHPSIPFLWNHNFFKICENPSPPQKKKRWSSVDMHVSFGSTYNEQLDFCRPSFPERPWSYMI